MAKNRIAAKPDPFEQDFEIFKEYIEELDLDPNTADRKPRASVFKIEDLQRLMNLPGATKIGFYPMPHKDASKTEGLMVALAYGDGLTARLVRIPDIPYVVALNNCPPDCLTDPFKRPKKAVKKAPKKVTKKGVKKATKKVAKKRPVKR